ncbi:MAG TPA: TlpA disulfide reductase family protein [Balneolaceae bacterium]
MRIDPKYFNHFLAVVAVVAAILIVFFTINSRQNQKAAFKKHIFAQDSLKTVFWPSLESPDSVRISDFKGQFVIVDFWANWSDASLNSQKELVKLQKAFSDTLKVIAASVGHSPETVHSYIQKYKFPFLFVNGSRHFIDFGIPGIPAQFVFNPAGDLQSVFLGYDGENRYDSLRALIHER